MAREVRVTATCPGEQKEKSRRKKKRDIKQAEEKTTSSHLVSKRVTLATHSDENY